MVENTKRNKHITNIECYEIQHKTAYRCRRFLIFTHRFFDYVGVGDGIKRIGAQQEEERLVVRI